MKRNNVHDINAMKPHNAIEREIVSSKAMQSPGTPAGSNRRPASEYQNRLFRLKWRWRGSTHQYLHPVKSLSQKK